MMVAQWRLSCGCRAPQSAAGSWGWDEQQEQGDPDSTQQPDWSCGLQGPAGTESEGCDGNVQAQYAGRLAPGPSSGVLTTRSAKPAARKMKLLL